MTPAALRQAERAKVLRKIEQLEKAAKVDQHSLASEGKRGYLSACYDIFMAVKRMR